MSNNAPDYENNLAFDPDINTMPRCDIEALKSEIKRLKELLKECRKILEILKCGSINDLTASRPHARNLLTKINAVIGESEK